MVDFKRGLNPAQWEALGTMASEGNNWWTHLLSLWVPSGKPAGDHGLRLAVRDRYLNFYRRGQSVARVCFGGQGEARMDIHAKYVWGKEAPNEYAQVQGSTVTRKNLPSSVRYEGLKTLKKWIEKSEDWAGQEKWGVDMVVGNNPTVIDLEMAIPAWHKKMSALRVDMAALDMDHGKPQLVLWEAKPLNAGALRARTGEAKVVAQMNEYKEYLEEHGHRKLLDEGYRTTCSALVELAKMTGRDIRLDDSVRTVAKASRLEVDHEPRLAVFKGVKRDEDGKPKLVDFSTGWAEHLGKLRRNKVKVADEEDPRNLKLGGAV